MVKAFEVDQKVLVRLRRLSSKLHSLTKKYFPLFVGPYRVRRIAHENAVELETLRTRKGNPEDSMSQA